jgi:hypothetical protein
MIEQAYQNAVSRLREDQHFPLLVPTLYEVAAFYRRMVPGARLAEIRAQLTAARLRLADVDAG